jgi:hypothetical protein
MTQIGSTLIFFPFFDSHLHFLLYPLMDHPFLVLFHILPRSEQEHILQKGT